MTVSQMPTTMSLNPWVGIYEKLARGEEITRAEAVSLCDAPAPMDLELGAYNPGPEHEDRAKILAKKVSAETQIGSIIVPDTAKRTSGEMIVIDCGSGTWDPDLKMFMPLANLKRGDRIVIGKYVGQDIELSWDEETGDPARPTTRVSNTFTAMFVKDIMAKYDRPSD